MDGITVDLVLIAVAVLANGFFSGSEIALVSSRAARLVHLRGSGTRGAATAMALKQTPESFLATIQVAITAAGTLGSAVGGAAAIEALTPALANAGVPAAWAEPAALAIVVVLITYVSLVIGELVPKAVALRDPERVACAVAPVISWISRVSGLLVRGLIASTNGVLRVVGLRPGQESPFVSEDEVRYLVREGAAKGIFEDVEAQLVHRVFEFADTTVRAIMVPRPNIRGLDVDTPATDVLRLLLEIGHSRIPVYRGSVEHVVGVVGLRDLLRAATQETPPSLAELARPPLFVPETAQISALLRELQRSRQTLALVVDEYGGIVGLVTLEDVLEEIVGEIRTEGEPILPFATRLPDGAWLLDGLAPLRDVRTHLGLPVEESEDYHTVAGLVIAARDAIPKSGTSISIAGHRWTVVEMDGPKITRVKVERERR